MNDTSFTINDSKLKELILYISKKSENDIRYGSTKLNKILFYSDFLMYFTRGKSITQQEYMKLDKGPVPRRFLFLRNELVTNKEAVVMANSPPSFAILSTLSTIFLVSNSIVVYKYSKTVFKNPIPSSL